MSSQPNDVGQVLKAEREKRAMTLEVVHEATKIPLDSLRAIEEGYKIRTLTTFYYKSFVKIYAQYLGLNVAEVLAMIPGSEPAPKKTAAEAVPKPPVASSRPVKFPSSAELNLFAGPARRGTLKKAAMVAGGILTVVIVMSLVSVVFGNIRKHFAVQAEMNAVKKKAAAKTVKAKAPLVKTAESTKTASSSTASAPTPAPAPVVKTAEAAKPAKTTATQKAPEKVSTETAPTVKTPKKASLTVRAPITVWLKVRVDGSTVYQNSLKKGNFETWNGSKRIELSGKGIAQLELEVNGKPIGKLGRPDINAKKIIVTPEGMSVEK